MFNYIWGSRTICDLGTIEDKRGACGEEGSYIQVNSEYLTKQIADNFLEGNTSLNEIFSFIEKR